MARVSASASTTRMRLGRASVIVAVRRRRRGPMARHKLLDETNQIRLELRVGRLVGVKGYIRRAIV
jgi:hypothetical protein